MCCLTLLTAGTKRISYDDAAQVLKGKSVEKRFRESVPAGHNRAAEMLRFVLFLIRWRFKTVGKQQAAGKSDSRAESKCGELRSTAV